MSIVAMKRTLFFIALIFAGLSALSSCDLYRWNDADKEKSHVVILVSAGYNNISSNLRNNISQLEEGFLPGIDDNRALFIVAHHSKNDVDQSTPVNPYVIRMYRDGEKAVRDTVFMMEVTDTLTSAAGLRKALSYIKKHCPSRSYGMVFSSHGTGWMPAGAYRDDSGGWNPTFGQRPVNYVPGGLAVYDHDPDPEVKTLGATTYRRDDGTLLSRELDITEFATLCPMKFDYIIFDACLAGGIEVAYQLRDVCNMICFSQTEVLSTGFDYLGIGSRLLNPNIDPDPVGVCRDYYEYYAKETGERRSATISAIDCSALPALAELSAILFAKYSAALASLDYRSVQRYYRRGYHWFYDFEDILLKAGMNAEEQRQLSGLLEKCIIYKAATTSFMQSISILHHSGLSMYLPCHGDASLDKYYCTLDWNKATGLVKMK